MFKKSIYFSFLLIALFLISGCTKEKTLTCTKTMDNGTMTIIEEVLIKFKNEKPSYLKTSYIYKDLDDDMKENWDELIKQSEAEINNDDLSDGLKMKFTHDDKKYIFKYIIEADFSKIDNNELEKYGLDQYNNAENTYDKLKETSIENGYTCK